MKRVFLPVDRRRFLLGTASAASLALIPSFAALSAQREAGPAFGRFQPFDLDWRFHRGEGEGYERPSFDDAGWRSVDLPHDWSIEDLPAQADPERIRGPFDRDAEAAPPALHRRRRRLVSQALPAAAPRDRPCGSAVRRHLPGQRCLAQRPSSRYPRQRLHAFRL